MNIIIIRPAPIARAYTECLPYFSTRYINVAVIYLDTKISLQLFLNTFEKTIGNTHIFIKEKPFYFLFKKFDRYIIFSVEI